MLRIAQFPSDVEQSRLTGPRSPIVRCGSESWGPKPGCVAARNDGTVSVGFATEAGEPSGRPSRPDRRLGRARAGCG